MIRFGMIAGWVMLLGWQAVALAWAPPEMAEPDEAALQAGLAEEAPAELDPFTVTGERTRSLVHRELLEVQRQVYRLFNQINQEDDYDMVCRLERRNLAKFTTRVCKARFHREAEHEASRERLEGLKHGYSIYHINRQELDREYDHQKEIMVQLANTYPEFRELLEKRFDLWREFESKGGKVRSGVSSD